MNPSETWRRAIAIGATSLTWLATTCLFWVGYAGSDDMYYARYAYLFHRPPINWWEFRMPAILALRASFHLFGASEAAAALPTLLASLAILASVAWFAGWPARLNWTTQAAVMLAATLPLDVGSRSTPGAPFFAAGFLSVGTVCLLKGCRWVQLLGAACFAIAFSAHESSIFYISIFCAAALIFDRRKYRWPVAACVALVACTVLVESAAYYAWLGDPLARLKVAASESANQLPTIDPDTHLSGIDFFAWPVKTLIFGKPFGFDLLLLLLTAIPAWRVFTREQRILLMVTFATWAWLGYGTKAPWAYKPFGRMYHYYAPLTLGIAALLPEGLRFVFGNRKTWACAAAGGVIAAHLVFSAAGGRWGAEVGVARELLEYAGNHPDKVYLTDVGTMNEMYVVGGFQFPRNIICLNGTATERHLLANKEPAGVHVFHFPVRPVDGILINLIRVKAGVEPEFTDCLKEHPGTHTRIVPIRYKRLFVPLLPVIGPRDFAVQSQGGEVVAPYAGSF